MQGRYSSLAMAIAVVATVFLAGAATAAEVTLKAVSAFAQGTNFSRNFESFIDRVNATGKGVVQINYIGGGGKVMSPFEVGNAVRTRVVDIGNLPGAFYTNLMPEADALKLTSDAVYEMKANGTFDFPQQAAQRQGQRPLARPPQGQGAVPLLPHQADPMHGS